jgi:predicted  nucleic acid-binding Zn-ribbon protein
MRTRHKPPTLVSMWMLDVFCCALGCMILLFVLATVQSQLRTMQVQLRTADAARSDERVKAVSAELTAARDLFDKTSRRLNSEVEDLKGKLVVVTDERDKTALALKNANADLSATRDKLTTAKAELVQSAAMREELEEELQKKAERVEKLDTAMAKMRAEENRLKKLIRGLEESADELKSAKKTADDALTDLNARYRLLEKESDDTTAALKAAGKVEDELAKARGVIKDLQKKFDDRNATIIDLVNQNQGLKDKADKLRAESESRFAGVAMTGKKVVFVVDASGSMTLIDSKTTDKNKWPGVIDTVGKVMRSLPDLESYQVVVFDRTARHLGGVGDWQKYKGEASVKGVTDLLTAITPGGDTNLYDAFELTFKLRATGLDTVYLFSDGLPSMGTTGLLPEQERVLSADQKTAALVKHLRATLRDHWNRPEERRRVRVNAIGFFYESPEVGAFLWALSRENDGSFVGMSKP